MAEQLSPCGKVERETERKGEYECGVQVEVEQVRQSLNKEMCEKGRENTRKEDRE